MFRIRSLFHLTHIAEDLHRLDLWYHHVFQSFIFYNDYVDHEDRDASIHLIGEFCMETVAPRTPRAEKTLAKFFRRNGPHLFHISFRVEGARELAVHLARHNVRIASVRREGGSSFEVPEDLTAFHAHPKDTFGTLLQFVETSVMADIDLRTKPYYSSDWWRDQHPLHVERLSHATVVLRDIEPAIRFYQEVLGAKLLHAEESVTEKRRSAYVLMAETVIELAQPTSSGTALAAHLDRHGEMLYSYTMKVTNLGQAARHPRACGTTPVQTVPGTIEIGPEQGFGAVIGFTERVIPNDPRGTPAFTR